MSGDKSLNPQRDDVLAQLLAQAGSRPRPPARLEAEVRAAVHAEWLHLSAARRKRRWLLAASLLLMVTAGGLLARLALRSAPTLPVMVQVGYAQGSFFLNDKPQQSVTVAAHGIAIHQGDVLRSVDQGARIVLNDGVTLRLAANSELRWLAAQRVQLYGRLYVDSHGRQGLSISTPHGEISHLGTQYLIVASAQALTVAVRSGRVAVRTRDAQLTVQDLEQLQLNDQRQISRSDLALDDATWRWADALATPFALENRSVAEFLEWVAGETGYQVQYANRQTQQAAQHTLLHGQQTNLPPLQALNVVLAVTDFRVAARGHNLEVAQLH